MANLHAIVLAMALPLVAAQTNATTNATTPGPTPDPTTIGLTSVMLLGATALIMVLFYMANAHVKEIRDQTWSMLAAAVSIFVAVMTHQVMNFVVTETFSLKEDDGATPATTGNIVSSVLQFICYWILVSVLLFCHKNSLLRLKGYGTIGGHIMGFASIHIWSQVCSLNPFRESAWWIVPVVMLLYLVFMSCFVGFFAKFGAILGSRGKVSKEDQDRWHEQSADTGTDFFCLGKAFLITTWIKFLIYGQLDPALTDATTQRDGTQTWWLFAVSMLFFILSAVATKAAHAKGGGMAWDVFCTVCATVAAMTLLDVWNWWCLAKAYAPLLGHLQIACDLTLISVVGVLIVAFLDRKCGVNKRALRGAFTGLALCVGSSWEKTFDAALDGLGDSFGIVKMRKTLVTLSLIVIVFPAWMVYILTKSDADLKKIYATNSPPVWAVCCDYDPCEEDDDDDVEEAQE